MMCMLCKPPRRSCGKTVVRLRIPGSQAGRIYLVIELPSGEIVPFLLSGGRYLTFDG